MGSPSWLDQRRGVAGNYFELKTDPRSRGPVLEGRGIQRGDSVDTCFAVTVTAVHGGT